MVTAAVARAGMGAQHGGNLLDDAPAGGFAGRAKGKEGSPPPASVAKAERKTEAGRLRAVQKGKRLLQLRDEAEERGQRLLAALEKAESDVVAAKDALGSPDGPRPTSVTVGSCLLYTSDAADE